MKALLNTIFLSLVITQAAFAGEGTCSSADQRLSYTRSWSEGGAALLPAHLLKLDGAILVQDGLQFEHSNAKVWYQEGERTSIYSVAMSEQSPQVDVFSEKMTLTDPKSGAVTYEDYILCRETSRPCPMCP